MLTFTKDDNNTYIVSANEKFIGRLEKNNGVWCLEYNDVSQCDMNVPYETLFEATVSDLENEFNIWLTHKDVKYFGEMSYTEYKNNKSVSYETLFFAILRLYVKIKVVNNL